MEDGRLLNAKKWRRSRSEAKWDFFPFPDMFSQCAFASFISWLKNWPSTERGKSTRNVYANFDPPWRPSTKIPSEETYRTGFQASCFFLRPEPRYVGVCAHLCMHTLQYQQETVTDISEISPCWKAKTAQASPIFNEISSLLRINGHQLLLRARRQGRAYSFGTGMKSC